jgi:hypothetical protein
VDSEENIHHNDSRESNPYHFPFLVKIAKMRESNKGNRTRRIIRRVKKIFVMIWMDLYLEGKE